MQNLESRYDFYGPQAQYLTQYDLLDEDQVSEELPEIDFGQYSHQNMFQERPEEDNCDQERLNFNEFVQKKLRIISQALGRSISCILKRAVLIFIGDVLEKEYLQLTNKNEKLVPVSRKNLQLTLLLYLLLLLIGTWMFPLQSFIGLTILFLMALTLEETKSDESQERSIIETVNFLIKELGTVSAQLKIEYVTNAHHSQKHQVIFDCLIKQLNIQVASNYGLLVTKTVFPLDNFDETIHEVVKAVNQPQIVQNFMRQGNNWRRKLLYWQVMFENYRLQKNIDLVQEVISQSKKQTADEKKSLKKRQPLLNFTMYLSILTQQLQELEQNRQPSELQKEHRNRIMTLLQKQIALEKVITSNSLMLQPVPETVNKQTQESEQPPITLETKKQRQVSQPLCYKEGMVQSYIPESHEAIRERLEEMMQKRRKKKQLTEKEERKEKEKDEVNWGHLKKERKIFGIPLLPPKRDMSEYYIE